MNVINLQIQLFLLPSRVLNTSVTSGESWKLVGSLSLSFSGISSWLHSGQVLQATGICCWHDSHSFLNGFPETRGIFCAFNDNILQSEEIWKLHLFDLYSFLSSGFREWRDFFCPNLSFFLQISEQLLLFLFLSLNFSSSLTGSQRQRALLNKNVVSWLYLIGGVLL